MTPALLTRMSSFRRALRPPAAPAHRPPRRPTSCTPAAPPCSPKPVRESLQLGLVRPRHRDPRALLDQRLDDRRTQPAARARHQRGHSRQVEHHAISFAARFDVLDRDHARHLGVGRDALDHRAEHLAADLDELLDPGRGHVGDAFAPADHAGDLLDQLVARSRPGSLARLGGDVGVERHRGRLRSSLSASASSIASAAGCISGQWNGALTGSSTARLAPMSLASSTARSIAPLSPEITTWLGSLSLATVHTSPSAAALAMRVASSRSAPSKAAIAPCPTGTAACIACPRSLSSLAVVARSNEPAAHKRRIFAEAVAGDEARDLGQLDPARPWSAPRTRRANGP